MIERKAVALALLAVVVFSQISFAGLVDDFLALGRQYEQLGILEPDQGFAESSVLSQKEHQLLGQIVNSGADLKEVTEKAQSVEAGLLSRLIDKVRFEVTLEKRGDLEPALKALEGQFQNLSRTKKKVANIGGRQVNLLDGEWRESPDGRRYWVSGEFPDIVLSAAEYRRYMATAVVVDD